jgi:hypothetical protein
VGREKEGLHDGPNEVCWASTQVPEHPKEGVGGVCEFAGGTAPRNWCGKASCWPVVDWVEKVKPVD